MITLKIFLSLIVTVAFLILAFSSKYVYFKKLVLFFFYLLAIFFVISPESADVLSTFLGIKSSGSILILYISVGMLFLFFANLYMHNKKAEHKFTLLIRELAIRDAYKTGNNKKDDKANS